MKTAGLLILGLLSFGCSNTPKTGNPLVEAPLTYQPRTAAALVFDPPYVLANAGPIDFSREGRGETAFYGYEQSRIETGYVYQRDEQRHFYGDGQFDRTAYSARLTTTVR